MRAIQLYAAGIADAVLEGKAAVPQVAVGEDEFVELDEEGKPRRKSPRGGVRARSAAVRKKAPARRARARRRRGGGRAEAAGRGGGRRRMNSRARTSPMCSWPRAPCRRRRRSRGGPPRARRVASGRGEAAAESGDSRDSLFMTITAEAVKQLRERTGAGMMECKKALVETNGDLDAAAELMRKQGLAKADKKARPRRRRRRDRRRAGPPTAVRRPWSKSTARPTSSPASTTSRLRARRWPRRRSPRKPAIRRGR